MRRKFVEIIDNYAIPKKEVSKYKRDRNKARKAAKKEFSKVYPIVLSQWEGSQDGEAVVAFNKEGEIQNLIHLDPLGVSSILKAIENKTLSTLLNEGIVLE